MLDAAFDKSQEVICFPTPQKEKDFRRGHAFHAHSNKGHTWPMKASLQKASRRNQQSWPSLHFAKTSLSSRHSPHRPWISKDPTSDNQHHASKIVQQTNQKLLIICPPLNIKAGRCVLTWEPLALITTCASSYTQTNNAWPTDTCEYITANNKKISRTLLRPTSDKGDSGQIWEGTRGRHGRTLRPRIHGRLHAGHQIKPLPRHDN